MSSTSETDAARLAERATEPVNTFILEVSAGRPKGVGDAGGVHRRIDDGLAQPTRALEPVVAAPLDGADANSAADLHEPVGHRRTASRRPPVSRRRTWPACSASLGVHAVFLALLGLVTITQRPALEKLDLVFASNVDAAVEFSETAIESPADPDDDVEKLVDEEAPGVIDPGEAPMAGDGGPSAMGPLSADALAIGKAGDVSAGAGTGSFGELGALFGDGGKGRGEFGSGLGAAPLAKFFGAQIEGRRIVFVLDNSGSMQDGRLETVIDELKRCVDSLAKDQQFYVIFYSDTVYPLFYPDPATRYVEPTPRNKQMLAAWLDGVELCLGDAVIEALSAAAAIEPDVVLLLSDGRIQGTVPLRWG